MKKYIIPICLIVILITQIYNYTIGRRVETAMFVVIIALMPSAIKGLELNIPENLFKIFEKIMVIFAIALLGYTLWSSM